MAINKGFFTSATDDWETPQALFDGIAEVFRLDIDVCASKENAKCEAFFNVATHNGLTADWYGLNVWCNPPYGRGIGAWVKKCYEHNQLAVMLLPARTDTKWWQDYCLKADCVHFVRGRLKFGDSKNSAPFPSAIVIFNMFKNLKG